MKNADFILKITILVLVLLTGCESDERYYRPNLPEKLSALGIIDADDTARYIIFEKSFQVEYPDEKADSLRELSFTISNSNGEIYSFQSDHALGNKSLVRLPDSLIFISGEKYFFRAKERDCHEISSEITVPEPPSGLKLLAISKEIVTNYVIECYEVAEGHKVWLDVISISFDNAKTNNSYYALLVESYGLNDIPMLVIGKTGKSYLEFALRKSNAPGFFTVFPGLVRYTFDPCNDTLIKNPAHAYYMEVNQISGNMSSLVLTIQSNDFKTIPTYPAIFRIRFLSIPEEMYMFEKSLSIYERNTGDPFSEPVYLKGNIKGGYGIFAICRSIELYVNAPLRY